MINVFHMISNEVTHPQKEFKIHLVISESESLLLLLLKTFIPQIYIRYN